MFYTIDRITPEDAKDLLEYFKLIGGESDNLSFGKEGLPFTIEQEQKYIVDNINFIENALFIAKKDGEIIGNSSFSSLSGRYSHRGEISVTVLKQYWNCGVGSELIKQAIKFAKECSEIEVISLEVRSDNISAIALYRKFGFEQIGHYRKFMKINEAYYDADLMNLYIK